MPNSTSLFLLLALAYFSFSSRVPAKPTGKRSTNDAAAVRGSREILHRKEGDAATFYTLRGYAGELRHSSETLRVFTEKKLDINLSRVICHLA